MKFSQLILLIVLVLGNIFFGFNYFKNSTLTEKNSLNSYGSLDKSATCYFSKTASASYYGIEKNIQFENFKDQKLPNVITFVDLDTKSPKAKGNNGEEALLNIYNNDDTELLISSEALNQGKLFSYSISKKNKVASWNKQYDILPGSPFSLLSMGYCE